MSEIKEKKPLGYTEIISTIKGVAQYLKEIRLPAEEWVAIRRVVSAADTLETLAADIEKEQGKDVEKHEAENQ